MVCFCTGVYCIELVAIEFPCIKLAFLTKKISRCCSGFVTGCLVYLIPWHTLRCYRHTVLCGKIHWKYCVSFYQIVPPPPPPPYTHTQHTHTQHTHTHTLTVKWWRREIGSWNPHSVGKLHRCVGTRMCEWFAIVQSKGSMYHSVGCEFYRSLVEWRVHYITIVS